VAWKLKAKNIVAQIRAGADPEQFEAYINLEKYIKTVKPKLPEQ
jgi:hypothetical protein